MHINFNPSSNGQYGFRRNINGGNPVTPQSLGYIPMTRQAAADAGISLNGTDIRAMGYQPAQTSSVDYDAINAEFLKNPVAFALQHVNGPIASFDTQGVVPFTPEDAFALVDKTMTPARQAEVAAGFSNIDPSDLTAEALSQVFAA